MNFVAAAIRRPFPLNAFFIVRMLVLLILFSPRSNKTSININIPQKGLTQRRIHQAQKTKSKSFIIAGKKLNG
jgi:hypothetical protein